MLTLYLLRHAKSSWDNPALSDFERPLNDRGRHDAVALGHYLQETDIHPELVLVSSAARTLETYQCMATQMSPKPDKVILKKLYGSSPKEIVAEVQKHRPPATTLMVIAHNPGIETLAWNLTAHDPSGALDAMQLKYPTAAMTTLTFDITTWADLIPKSGTLTNFTSPKLRRGV